jgi:hypothetical protein
MRHFLDKFGPHLALLVAILLTTLALTCSADEILGTATPSVNKPLPMPAAILVAKADQEIVKVRTALVESLKKAQADATKKGDLDGALSIKAKIEQVSADLPAKPAPVTIEATAVEYQGAYITKATYGTEAHSVDCMMLVKRILKGETLAIDNNSLGFDPVPNQPKHVTVRWVSPDGKAGTTFLEEGRPLTPADLFAVKQ